MSIHSPLDEAIRASETIVIGSPFSSRAKQRGQVITSVCGDVKSEKQSKTVGSTFLCSILHSQLFGTTNFQRSGLVDHVRSKRFDIIEISISEKHCALECLRLGWVLDNFCSAIRSCKSLKATQPFFSCQFSPKSNAKRCESLRKD